MKFYVLTIEHEYGRTVTGHLTEDQAHKSVLAYVDEWWVREKGEDNEPPEDPAERIEEYFEDLEDECYDIDAVEVAEVSRVFRMILDKAEMGIDEGIDAFGALAEIFDLVAGVLGAEKVVIE